MPLYILLSSLTDEGRNRRIPHPFGWIRKLIPSRAARVDREGDERPVQLVPACSRRFAIAETPRRSEGFPGANITSGDP